MNTHFSRSVLSLVLVVVFTLALLPSAGAQDNAPPAVGLRPDAPPYAVHGPYWVGTREFVVEPESDRPLPVTVWYPALNPDGSEDYAIYDMGIGRFVPQDMNLVTEGHALADEALDLTGAPYPLVIISHGLGGSRFSYFQLAEHLASYGFIVIGIEHVGTAVHELVINVANVGDPGNIVSLYYRPSDVARTIAYADTLTTDDGPLAGLIDTELVAIWGHSTGGTTVFQAGGAQIDFPALLAWCDGKELDPFADESCQFVGHEANLAALYGVEASNAGLFRPLWDDRVDALVAAAPGGELHAFGDAGIGVVGVPTMIMYGSSDPFVSPEYNALWAYHTIASADRALVTFENGGHLMFGNCPGGWKDFCGYDPVWDVDRVHDLINHFTTAFLLATLEGDTDAAAALSPDAVSFPGIEYQAQGF